MSALAETVSFTPNFAGFAAFCGALGETLEPHQRKIAKAVINGPEREVGVCVGRGNDKTSTAALLGVHYLLSTPGADVTIGAGSRDQGRIAFERMRGFAEHPALAGQLTIRHLELRGPEAGLLRVIPSDGPRAHGLSSGLYIADELWGWPDKGLLEAMLTGLIKRPDARFLGISTAPAHLDTPWGRMRARALSQPDVRRRGVFVEARGAVRWLEWSAPEDADLNDYRLAARVNPASRFTPAVLEAARARVPELAYRQFHLNQAGITEAAWLPAGAWQGCHGPVDLTPREIILGIDIGGSRAASALVGVTPDLQVPICEVFEGDESVLAVTDAVLRLQAEGWIIRELVYDPWRYQAEALRLRREHGVVAVEFPQSHARMTAASEGLHAVVVEGRLRHPGHPDLDRHVAGAVARQTGRGWRLDKAARDVQIDAVIALAEAVERAQFQPEPVRLLGWL
ncbi:MAG: terminase large subunit [Actinomycetota bacterium]|nr:terminase large subunit [Actinomycetota bacterium]